MRIPAVIFACLLALTGCDKTPATHLPATPPVPSGLASGLDLAGLDNSIRPQDDLFRFANGTWLSNTEIPADKSSWGSFNILQDKSLEQLRIIVDDAATHPDGDTAKLKIGNFYKAFVDAPNIESLGATPLAEELETIAALDSHADVARYFGVGNAIGIDSPVQFWIDQDAKNSLQYIVYFTQSGLGLPDRDYYFDNSQRGVEIREKYTAFLTLLLRLSAHPDPAAAATGIIALETQLATHHWSKVANRDRDKTYNKFSTEQLAVMLDQYNFPDFLHGLGLNADTGQQRNVIVRQPSYIAALNELFTTVDVQTWKDYLRVKTLTSFAPFLSRAYADAHFDFYNRTLSGQPQQEPRWKRAINAINSTAGELLGQLYVARHFPPQAKTRMLELVDNLVTAYRQSIDELDWMSPPTKRAALEKLARFTPKIGYPDRWKDYGDLHFSSDDLVGNIRRARIFSHNYDLNKLGKPVDRGEWYMPPQQVNAYYNPGLNEIVFPAAILQPPFFDLHADDAVNYGAIGAVIGHEIGHGFDDQGSKSDGDGNLVNWWSDADRKQFEQKTRHLVSQFAAYEPLPGLTLNGELTLGENIGDLGGLSIAHKAYMLALQGKPAPTIDGFTGEQRVFLGWAQAWRVKRRDELTEQLIKTDPHSPPEFRVNGVVPNIDSFYQAFDVKPGDGLYLPEEQRVRIW